MTKKENLETKKSLPWLIPVVKRPNFYFPRIRISLKMTIPNYVWMILIYSLIFYIYMGGVYNAVIGHIPAYGQNKEGEITIIKWDPSLRSQYLMEGLVAAMMMFLASFGLYLMRYASLDPHNVRRAENYQLFGIIIIVLALIVLKGMMDYKTQKYEP